MRFLPGTPDIPDELIRDVVDGKAVFLCGAGVSMRVKMPSFKELADRIYTELGETPGRQEPFLSRHCSYDSYTGNALLRLRHAGATALAG